MPDESRPSQQAVSAVPASIPDAAKWNPLGQLDAIAEEAFERWDKDMRSGKLLLALSGALPDYRADITSVRLACVVAPALLSTIRCIHMLASREGGFGKVDPETALENISGFSAPEVLARMFAEMPAQAIEARRAATTGAVEDESAVRQDAPKEPSA